MKKLVLGTAQFNSTYGITNKIGNLKQKTINDIIRFFRKKKFNFIETSNEYGSAVNKISKSKEKKFNYIYKLNLNKFHSSMNISVINIIKKTLKKLKIKKFEYLLIQNFDKNRENKDLINLLKQQIDLLKINKLIKKFGISTYNFYNITYLKKLNIDAIQLPFNIFDQRLLKKNYHKKLKKENIDIFVRSIFLQGLLLEDANNIKQKFKKFKKDFVSFEKICSEKNYSKLEACILFVKKIKEIKGIIVGVLSKKELNEIIKIYYKKKKKLIFSPINKLRLIDISKW